MRIEKIGNVCLAFEHKEILAVQDLLRQQDHLCGTYEAGHIDKDGILMHEICYFHRQIPVAALRIFDAVSAGRIAPNGEMRMLAEWVEAAHARAEAIFDAEFQRMARPTQDTFER